MLDLRKIFLLFLLTVCLKKVSDENCSCFLRLGLLSCLSAFGLGQLESRQKKEETLSMDKKEKDGCAEKIRVRNKNYLSRLHTLSRLFKPSFTESSF